MLTTDYLMQVLAVSCGIAVVLWLALAAVCLALRGLFLIYRHRSRIAGWFMDLAEDDTRLLLTRTRPRRC